MLDREELIEQAYFFRVVSERMTAGTPMQELLGSVKEEILATTKLPLAIDFLLGELRHLGVMATAMARLPHYFTAFQTYVIAEAEDERGKFDFRTALEILRKEAEYKAQGGTIQGVFIYQFETLCRNRLKYDPGLDALSKDPLYDAQWRDWIQMVRRQVGLVDFADLIYVRSQHFFEKKQRSQGSEATPDAPILFTEREGKIALANRKKDPLLLFAALQRQLGYPEVPRLKPVDQSTQLLPQMARRLERLEARIKLLEEENRAGIDITKFYSGSKEL